ncbi:hypothetical protein PtA15_5A348 [Puccinia triticina]|uniref:Uncharacterized protein n=1 Tax=Puccinia triticina TaxID=208348 RepID=A0ABY7CI63_9BASI|nr:uncharacterized protein PtA15_5A348 [Puccinia triticina]WAQ84775.1 hypothetical protein PtA15_5A348 [Puccinia triticina]WAR58114.1 hypothetical protein PtB15_5B346 [Puccinia triticina]
MALGLLFFLLLLGTLLAYFLIPRVPEVAYNNKKTFEGDSTTGLSFEALEPAWFAFSTRINLAIASKTSSFRPHTNTINVVVKDLLSARSPIKFARGSSLVSLFA